MDAEDIIKTWQANDDSLNKLWTLNLRCIEMVQTQKARAKLNNLAIFKIIVIILGLLYVLFLGALVYFTHLQNMYFTVSIGVIILVTVIAMVVYVNQIIIIRKINYSESVLDTQEKLAVLQSSTINIGRVLWLQTPFWSTFFWSSKWIIYSDVKFWLIPFPITLLLTFAAIWLYRNISLKNVNKKWFKILFGSMEWTSLTKASAFLGEIDAFKKA
jgi:hypothetical protein